MLPPGESLEQKVVQSDFNSVYATKKDLQAVASAEYIELESRGG